MSNIDSQDGLSEGHTASETIRAAARRVSENLDQRRTPGQSADIVRGMVREAPLWALASAFLMGILIGRR